MKVSFEVINVKTAEGNREYKPVQANLWDKNDAVRKKFQRTNNCEVSMREDEFNSKCSVCELTAYEKGQSVAGAKKGRGKKDGGGGLRKLF